MLQAFNTFIASANMEKEIILGNTNATHGCSMQLRLLFKSVYRKQIWPKTGQLDFLSNINQVLLTGSNVKIAFSLKFKSAKG